MNGMKTKTALEILVILVLSGSLVTFYTTNLVLSDVANMFYMTITRDVISSIPGFMFSLEMVLASIFVMRWYMRPQYKKRMTLLYCRITACFSAVGMVSSVLTGSMIYGSFAAPYPFPGYCILGIVLHLFVMISCVCVHVQVKKRMPDDPSKRNFHIGYIIYTAFMSLTIFFAFDRFGALLWMPCYVHLRTLHITFPFYISLLLPLANLGHIVLSTFGVTKRHMDLGIAYAVGLIAADIILAGIVFGIGMSNPQFISAVSPALAIERLLTKPVDTIVQFALVLVLALYSLRYSIKYKKNHTQK